MCDFSLRTRLNDEAQFTKSKSDSCLLPPVDTRCARNASSSAPTSVNITRRQFRIPQEAAKFADNNTRLRKDAVPSGK